MNEIQTLLKNTLVKWERNTLLEQQAQAMAINELEERIKQMQNKQIEFELLLLHLSKFYLELEKLLQQLSNTVSNK